MLRLRVNNTTGCERPTRCRGYPPALCGRCYLRQADPDRKAEPPIGRGAVVRIAITSARRRHLGDMAREAGKSVDEFASGLLSDLIDDDAKAHGEAG